MIVTTSRRTTIEITSRAKAVSAELLLPFIVRNDQPIEAIWETFHSDVIVVCSNRIEIHVVGQKEPVFFHPNSAMFRVKRYLRGETDPFLVASKLSENMSLLDCTLGLGSDSILSSVVVGKNGTVVGIEANQYLAYIAKQGLASWKSGHNELDDGMARIQVIHAHHYDYLKSCPNSSFDVVYFDPMFEVAIDESDGINGLRNLAMYDEITEKIINEAKRVARQRIVLKDYWKSERFQQFGFTVYKRPTALFHYGSIESK